jgi:sigma-B regulation protein RsbU (phosphoserine phosphatase)
MASQERRQAERIILSPPLAGRLHDQDVRIIDIGPLGTRVEHDRPLSGAAPLRLMFQWAGDEIALDCLVARSEARQREGPDQSNGFDSGLEFRPPENGRMPQFRRMLTSLEEREEIERLKTLVEASKLINSSIEPDALFDSILSVARNELGVERGTLYFVDEKNGEIWAKIAAGLTGREIRLPMGKGIAGAVAATGEHIILHDAYADDRFDRSLDSTSGFRTRSMLCVPIKNRNGKVVGVLQLLNKSRGSFGERDLVFLDSISDHMAIAMENATLHLELIEKQRMERELQLGREIQSGLFPTPPSDISGVEIAAMSLPCYEVGGDYYDFIELPGGDLGLAIGDVSGKGVAAALIMSSVQAALRVAAPIEPDISMLIARLNALLYRSARGRKYATFFFGRFTPSTGELRYVNAGHNPPLLVEGGRLSLLDSTGRPVGILPDSPFAEMTVRLERGSSLILYTDGLNEAADPEDEEFGMERLERLVRAAVAEETVAAMPGRILDAIIRFERGAHASDDKTIVVLRRT